MTTFLMNFLDVELTTRYTRGIPFFFFGEKLSKILNEENKLSYLYTLYANSNSLANLT